MLCLPVSSIPTSVSFLISAFFCDAQYTVTQTSIVLSMSMTKKSCR